MAASRVAVVGGGLAGLSAALELKRLGANVTLFERSRLLGGKATSFTLDGIEVDNGQHVYLACCTEFIDFVARAGEKSGAGDVLTLQPEFDVLLLARGRAPARLHAGCLPAPLHLAPSLARYKYLSLGERVQLARAVMAVRRPPRAGETFDAWLARHGQSDQARAAFWEPLFVPALNAPLGDVSAEDALFVIRVAFLSNRGAARFGYARVPLARIAEAAARQLDAVHLRTPVAGLLMNDGSKSDSPIRGVQLEGGDVFPCDGVVLAVPPSRLARLLSEPESLGLRGLETFRTAPIVDVHLWFDVPRFGFDFAALLGSPVQWVFEKGAGYVCCSMSAAGRYIRWPNADLVDLCVRELTERVPGLAGAKLLRGHATRDREATFVPTPGLRRPGPVTKRPDVVIAGAWTDTGWPATMESAVRSGRAAARALAVQMGAKVAYEG